MSEARHVLMIGGPADGRWMVANGHEVIVAEPPVMDWKALTADPLTTIDFRQVRYVVQPCGLFGFKLDVAVAEGEFRSSHDRNKAVARALFQRDVAEAMGAYV